MNDVSDFAPNSIEAEQAVLGALLLDRNAWRIVTELLDEQAFYAEPHRAIFRSCGRLVEQAQPIDALTVSEALKASGELERAGGLRYLHQLAQGTPGSRNVAHYAKIVAKHSRARELAAIGERLRNDAMSPRADVDVLLHDAAASLRAFSQRAHSDIEPMAWGELAAREPPQRKWAVDGYFGFGHVTLLVGQGGIGKTLLVQQIGSVLSINHHHFIDQVHGPFRVLFWACEDDHDELWRRQLAIAQWLGVGLDAFSNLITVPRHGLDNALVVTNYGRLVFTGRLEELRQQAEDLQADVVILDNAAQLYGASENDRHSVTAFLNGLVGSLPGRAVMLLAHPSRSQGSEYSGSSAWENTARMRLYLGTHLPDEKRDPDEELDDHVRYLSRRKTNYSVKDWRRFTFSNGVLVPDDPEPASGGMVRVLRERASEHTVIEGLRALAAKSIRATEGTSSPDYLPRLLIEYGLANGHTKPELAGATRRLRLAGKLESGIVGRYPNRTTKTGLVVAEDAHK